MGRLSLGNKSAPGSDQAVPPLPSHNNGQSPSIATETSTSTEVVTPSTETTHFLSFPGWRKGSNAKHKRIQRPRTAGSVERNERRAQRDKALPPTPSDSSTHLPLSLDTLECKSKMTTFSRNGETPRSHPTAMLAQTSLGLGLSQHVLSHAAASSTPRGNEVNTVSFISSSTSVPNAEHFQTVRRSKSSQKLDTSSNPNPDQMGLRTRGISLGPASLLNYPDKGEEKAAHPPKAISRRPSFWSRRKHKNADNSQARPVTTHGDISQHHRSHEVNLSDLPSTPPRRQKLQARDPISHTFLERPQSYHPLVGPGIAVSPAVERLPSTRRPSTAGSQITAEHGPSTSRLTPGSGRTTAVSFSEMPTNSRAPFPRARSQTSPPLLHRLSLNVLSSSTFFSASPTSSPTSPLPSPLRKPLIIPRPMENEESPDVYVNRLVDTVSKIEVTGILASSAEPFFAAALKAFITRFDFTGHPLDIALRKLLLEIGLPKETQQIDRVMEAFAQRYIHNNPDLYVSEDHPYILAFSLIILHTDAFNKSNKHKMTKADYVKNTRLPGVAPEILEYLYDNIIFAPFIFIEDPLDPNGQWGLVAEPNRRSTVFRDSSPTDSSLPPTGSTIPIRTNKIDPYYMISANLLGPLRIDVGNLIPLADPFSYQGTAVEWNEEELLLAFADAQAIEVRADTTRASAFFGLATGTSSSPHIPNNSSIPDIAYDQPSILRVTKAGLINRKDELCEGGRKPLSRKWRSWVVLLTGSQLLFSRDQSWMQALGSQAENGDCQVLIPPLAMLKVDESLSLKNAVAVHDKSYTKHQFTFRLALSDGRHILFETSSESDMNQWIARINYASAFKAAGIRMRLVGMSGRSMQLTGVAAATSHLHDLQNQIHSPCSESATWGENAPRELFEMLSGDRPTHKRPHLERKVTLRTNREEVELEASMPLEIEKTVEFKDAFDQVKADLAAESWTQVGQDSQSAMVLSIPFLNAPRGNLPAGSSPEEHLQAEVSSNNHLLPLPRSQIIESTIIDLNDRLIATETHLDTHMRFVRSVAALTPFQRATRDRLIAAVQARARTVMQLRLDIVRMRCHRNVLRDDLEAENRIWKEVKDTALKAAKETLQSRQQSPEIPQVALSMRKSPHDLLSTPLQAQRRQKAESSICESFHTAIDFGPDWPSSDDLGSSFLAASRVFDSPRPSTSGSFSSYPLEGNSSRIWKNEAESGSQADHDVTPKGEELESDKQHEKFSTAQESVVEEAEVWNKTRCAKRVSLVRVPSTLDLLPVSKRLTLTLSTTTGPQS